MMRTVFAFGLLLGAIALISPVASIASSSNTICMEATPQGRCVIRPHSLPYGAHASVYGIRWHRWDASRAIGYGHILWRRTVSEPRFGPYAAKLILSEVGECGSRFWYSRRTLKIKRGFRQTLEHEEPFGPCFE